MANHQTIKRRDMIDRIFRNVCHWDWIRSSIYRPERFLIFPFFLDTWRKFHQDRLHISCRVSLLIRKSLIRIIKLNVFHIIQQNLLAGTCIKQMYSFCVGVFRIVLHRCNPVGNPTSCRGDIRRFNTLPRHAGFNVNRLLLCLSIDTRDKTG